MTDQLTPPGIRHAGRDGDVAQWIEHRSSNPVRARSTRAIPNLLSFLTRGRGVHVRHGQLRIPLGTAQGGADNVTSFIVLNDPRRVAKGWRREWTPRRFGTDA